MITIAPVALPEFGAESLPPVLGPQTYRPRLDALKNRLPAAGLDVLAVYADREHSANLAYLTGLDPRFEEALLLLGRHGHELLLVGNECMGYLPDAQLGLKVELFQEFSLMGQPRTRSRALKDILAGFGLRPGAKIGVVGWKVYDSRLTADTKYASDAPSYLVDLLREFAGGMKSVLNATGLLVDPAHGLRIVNIEPEQIACFEYAAVRTSRSVRAVMERIRPGVREDELEKYLDSAGLPLTCHNMIRFGENARRGLASPSANRAQLGDVYTVGFGIVGSLTSRAGAVAEKPEDVPAAAREFYGKFAANYFDVVATWYEKLRIGVTGGAVFAAVEAKRDKALYDFAVNPGHYIHLEEWVHSPFAPGSEIRLASGMALQMDIIPVSKGPFCYANVEDGIVLADEALRRTLAEKYPAMWRRMQARRAFMAAALGLRLDDSVLPLSNTPAYLPPYVMAGEKVFVQT